jgi:hypothetical protein
MGLINIIILTSSHLFFSSSSNSEQNVCKLRSLTYSAAAAAKVAWVKSQGKGRGGEERSNEQKATAADAIRGRRRIAFSGLGYITIG